MFYQCGPIDHCTHVPGPFAQYSSESEYNAACTAGMDISHYRMLNNKLMNKDSDVVPEQADIIILDRKLCLCMANIVKYAKHIRHIARIMHFVRNGEKWNQHKTLCCEVGLQFSDIRTKDFKEDKFQP